MKNAKLISSKLGIMGCIVGVVNGHKIKIDGNSGKFKMSQDICRSTLIEYGKNMQSRRIINIY